MSFKYTNIEKIPLDWTIYKQGEIATFINGRAYKNSEFKDSGTPIIRIQNLKGEDSGKVVYSDLHLDDDKYIEHGDLIYAWSATFGPYIWRGPRSIYHYHIWKIKCNEGLDKNFFYYKLMHISNRIATQGTGSIFSHITKNLMENQEIGIPFLDEQKSISNILSSLDSKIELNNAINKNLEEMAQALFKRWFLDFEFPNENGEPYKSSGGEFEESELGLIPKGWKISILSEICKLSIDSLNKHDNWEVINYLDTGNITNNNINQIQTLNSKEDKIPSRAKKKIKPNDIVYSTVRPNQRHYGLIKEPVQNMVVSTGFAVLTSNGNVPNDFIYLWLTQEAITQHLQTIAENSTSTYPSIKPNDILALKLVIPKTGVINLFCNTVEKIHTIILKNQKNNEILSSLRDTLLPKLMSGEIRVPLDKA